MRPVARIAVPFVAVVAFTGCAHSLSTAAVVGDKVISEARAIEAMNSCRKINPQIKRLDMLFPLIFGEITDEVSPKLGRTIDAAKLHAVMEADPDTSQAFGTPYQKVVEDKLKVKCLQASADVEAILQELLRAEINPHYGAWSPCRIDHRDGPISVETKG